MQYISTRGAAPELNFEDLNFNSFDGNTSNSMQIEYLEFHFDKLKLLGK